MAAHHQDAALAPISSSGFGDYCLDIPVARFGLYLYNRMEGRAELPCCVYKSIAVGGWSLLLLVLCFDPSSCSRLQRFLHTSAAVPLDTLVFLKFHFVRLL